MKKGLIIIALFLALIIIFGRVVFYIKNHEKVKDKNQIQSQLNDDINKNSKAKETEPTKSSDVNQPKIPEIKEENPKLPISIENIEVLSYQGKYADFIPLINANFSLETSIQSSVKILEEKSGLYPTKEDVIKISLTDSKNLTSNYPYDVEEKPDGSFKIDVSLQKILYNSLPVHEIVASGIAESLLAKKNKNFLKLPRFFRFGVAASLSGLSEYIEKQEVLKIERDGGKIAFSAASETSNPVLNGIFLLKFLTENYGLNSPKDILPVFSESGEFIELIERITKFSFSDIEQNYIKYSKNRYSNLVRFGSHFNSIISQLRNLKEEETLPILQDFLRNNPTDIHYGEGLYYFGYIHYRLGNYAEAEKVFKDLLINHSFETISHGKAHFFLGRCYKLRGFSSLALPEYRYALLDENELLKKVASRNIEELLK